MGLLPIEFKDAFSDSPYFRSNIQAHERELEQTSSEIKTLIREIKELISAARALSKAQRNFANSLSNFSFECIGGSQTDDEIIVAGSLKQFGKLLSSIEDERERVLECAASSFIEPLEKFRREQIGGVKEGKKKFDKETAKFCSSLERHLNLTTKKSENQLQEADASLEMEQRYFMKASLEYVRKLQEVQERKKFEFVETILSFMYGSMNFYHQGHEVAKDFKKFMTDLQIILQRTRENYESTQNETDNLMKKMLEDKSSRSFKSYDSGSSNKMYTRQGYLYLMEKKAFGTTWTKTFCQYQKENRLFTMISYNQVLGKIGNSETITLKECNRRMSDSIEKRFCFDVVSDNLVAYTLQALSEEDRKLWLEAMEAISNANKANNQNHILGNGGDMGNGLREEYVLDQYGLEFIKQLIEHIEKQGLEDQGIYRVSGVSSKITKLMRVYQDNYKNFLALNSDTYSSDGQSIYFDTNKIQLSVENIIREFSNHDLKTVTSALKNYLRNLYEPLLSFKLHSAFISAAKIEQKERRVNAVHELVHNLPKINFQMLSILIKHLNRIAEKSDKNLMSVCNLGVCFGPTLLRSEEESVAAIMNLKFCNVVVEILIENYDKIFNTKPLEINNSKPILSCYNNTLPMNNNLQTTIGLPQPLTLLPHHLQHQTNFNNLISPNRVAANNNNFNNSNHQQQQHFNFRQASQQQQQHQLIHQQQSNNHHPNNFNSLNNLSMPNHLNHAQQLIYPTQQTSHQLLNDKQQFNSFNRPIAGMYNNWNSANNINLIDTHQYQINNNTNSFIPYNTNSIRAVPATVQQNCSSSTNNLHQQSTTPTNTVIQSNSFIQNNTVNNTIIQHSPTLSRSVGQSISSSSNFYVPYTSNNNNLNSNCNLSNNSANTTNSSNSNLITNKMNSLSNNNLLNSIKNLTIDVNQPINTSSSSSSSSALSINLSQSLSKSNTALNSGDSNKNYNLQNNNSTAKISNQSNQQIRGRSVKALYACVAESSTELSFTPNTIIRNVYESGEPGWLKGELNGLVGLIPKNYVKYID